MRRLIMCHAVRDLGVRSRWWTLGRAAFGVALCLAIALPNANAAEIRWLGHDRVVDAARLADGAVTLGNDGLVIFWRGETAERWAQVDDASILIAAATGVLAASPREVVTLDLSLAEVGRQALDGAVACRGVEALWWWTDAGSLDVFTQAGGARREGAVVPHGDARCGVSPAGSALAWVDASTAYLAVWSGTSIDIASQPWDRADTPVPQWDGASWRLASNTEVRRFCDTWAADGQALPCRTPAFDAQFAELPRELTPEWVAHLGERLIFADAFGWSVLEARAAVRHTPPAWMTLGLLSHDGAILVAGCQTAASGSAMLLVQPKTETVVARTDVVGSCAELVSWVDGRGLSAVDGDGVITWNDSATAFERTDAPGVLAQTPPLGPFRSVFRLRESWSALCGAHTALERVSASGEASALPLPCAAWRALAPLYDSDGQLVGTTVTGEQFSPLRLGFSGAAIDATLTASTPALAQGEAVPVVTWPTVWQDLRVTLTTRGIVLRQGEHVWLSETLRPFAALVSDAEVAYAPRLQTHPDFDIELPALLLEVSAR